MSFEAFSWVWAGGANASREYFRVYGAAGQVSWWKMWRRACLAGRVSNAVRCVARCAVLRWLVQCAAKPDAPRCHDFAKPVCVSAFAPVGHVSFGYGESGGVPATVGHAAGRVRQVACVG